MTDRSRIPHPLTAMAASVALLWLNSCALAQDTVRSTPAAPTPATPASHAAIAEALLAGSDAGATDADRLLWAADQLSLLGAKAASDGEDLAQTWRAQALARGARPTQRPITRGRALGAAYRRGTLAPYGTSSTDQVFLAGEKAIVTVVPLGLSSLQVKVHREGDAPACQRSIGKPQASCQWVPDFTRRYTISVSNPGAQSGGYYLIVD